MNFQDIVFGDGDEESVVIYFRKNAVVLNYSHANIEIPQNTQAKLTLDCRNWCSKWLFLPVIMTVIWSMIASDTILWLMSIVRLPGW